LGDKRVGDLSEGELKRIEDIIANPGKHGISPWLCNRRSDPEDGADKHLISAQLELRRKMDINELKKRKCYRGVRHIIGLPVRGQRTRSSFRKAATVGVSRVKAKPAAAKAAKK
ncbi:MAG: 30S ribosomal protein S13, partial [Candidatus Aenigmarchaeota archaeon]|nr:30S ribosomal protein S13 [Candidatus Aenigmarchaeota archaeon]